MYLFYFLDFFPKIIQKPEWVHCLRKLFFGHEFMCVIYVFLLFSGRIQSVILINFRVTFPRLVLDSNFPFRSNLITLWVTIVVFIYLGCLNWIMIYSILNNTAKRPHLESSHYPISSASILMAILAQGFNRKERKKEKYVIQAANSDANLTFTKGKLWSLIESYISDLCELPVMNKWMNEKSTIKGLFKLSRNHELFLMSFWKLSEILSV